MAYETKPGSGPDETRGLAGTIPPRPPAPTPQTPPSPITPASPPNSR
jgi:hypothetical protein